MAWCNSSNVDERAIQIVTPSKFDTKNNETRSTITCPSCGHILKFQDQAGIHDLPGLPAGVRFDPSDQEILEHLASKVLKDNHNLHPLIDEFILTIDGENGICYTHPEKLPGVSKDGLVSHFFHRPSKAYTTGTRKRRKVHTEADGSETRWHKTGKTRAVIVDRSVKGFKKILVLYTNYGRQKKPEKTNWVMHQYHLGNNEEEKEGELVMSKIFYQTQPRQCGSSIRSPSSNIQNGHENSMDKSTALLKYYNPPFISFEQGGHIREIPSQLIPNLVIQGDASSLSVDADKEKAE